MIKLRILFSFFLYHFNSIYLPVFSIDIPGYKLMTERYLLHPVL